MKKIIAVTGGFDDLRSHHVRFLEEAGKRGELHVLLWKDGAIQQATGKSPRFTLAERHYFLSSIRYVSRVWEVLRPFEADTLPKVTGMEPDEWVVSEVEDNRNKRLAAASACLGYHVIPDASLLGFPAYEVGQPSANRRKVIVTGCYDWLHTGHIRFFEETSVLGDLYVTLGHDENIRMLKGEGHPQFEQEERRYMVQSIRFVKQAIIATGDGWLDAEPEIYRLKPDIYAVNEDGDRPEKRLFCEAHGIEYTVLKRTPKAGLPRRQSTDLRGF